MHCLTVTYEVPDDPAHFKDYYVKTHIPLARALPGLLSLSYGFPEPMTPAPAPFCIFQAYFTDVAAMEDALRSEIGARVAADVPNYSPTRPSLSHHEVQGG
jgi:uncharacterized protein (TIGR02118 family)